MTKTGAAATPTVEDKTESLFEWVQLNARQLSYGAIAVVALGASVWLWQRSKEMKADRAETAYFQAQRSVLSGNIPLAESDLKKMITRYEGTPSANLASLLLAQVMYDQGKYDEGVKGLQKLVGHAGPIESSVLAMIASGYEEQKKYPEAAAQYLKAAAATPFEVERDKYKADAARDLMAGGNKAEARKIWTEIASVPEGPVAGEARVRLGELTATPAGR
jgi:predicted negative regulator of RcsB-dependent stress response